MSNITEKPSLKPKCIWDVDKPPSVNYLVLGSCLAACEGFFRNPDHAGGLLLVTPEGKLRTIDTGQRLRAALVDHVFLRVVQGKTFLDHHVSHADLDTMLRSETFLGQFNPLDGVVSGPHYLPDFRLMQPGYNPGIAGHRFYCAGSKAEVANALDAIPRFLDVMAFASNADRTNAVAAALTVLLRNHWPGGKPALVVTSTKSHGGKDTVILFASGTTPKESITYEPTDWALQNTFVAAVKRRQELGVIVVENARLDRGGFIRSGFLERIITDPEPAFYSPSVGGLAPAKNDLVIAISGNDGTVSEDLMNRALPVHMNPQGNVADRISPIGNPKLEFLPANRDLIVAELRFMVRRWDAAGRPLDEDVKHPFTQWAKTVGGIVKVNGFTGFLGNYGRRKTADDPLRRGLGLLAAAGSAKWRPPEQDWRRPADWGRLAVEIGVARSVIPVHDRDTDAGRARGIGVVLSAHKGETFHVETDDEALVFRLEGKRPRFGEPRPTQRYRFVVEAKASLPTDPEDDGLEPATEVGGGTGHETCVPDPDWLSMAVKRANLTQHELGRGCKLFRGEVPATHRWDANVFEEAWLLLPTVKPRIAVHGFKGPAPRTFQAFGRDYPFARQQNPALPIPDLLKPLLEWVQQTIDLRLNGILLTGYEGPKEYIGPHHDKVTHLVPGSPIITISYGEERTFRLTLREKVEGKPMVVDTKDFPATDGTLYLLPFDTNKIWQHEIPKFAHQTGRRISVTVRAFV